MRKSSSLHIPYYAVLNVTRACNFNCRYCYNDSGTTDQMMSTSIALKCLQIMNSLPSKSLAILFHGGEPLLNLPAIKEITSNIKKVSCKPVHLFIQTNASLLDDEVFELLTSNNIHLGISVDGTTNAHNQCRLVRIDNLPSFDLVFNKIESLLARGIPFNLLTVVTTYNVDHLAEILEFYAKMGVLTFAFNLFIASGRGSQCSDLQPNAHQLYSSFVMVFERIVSLNKERSPEEFVMERNTYYFVRNLIDKVPRYMCMKSPCGAGRSILSFSPDGDIFPCDDFSSISDFSIGNVTQTSSYNLLDILSSQSSPILTSLSERSIDNIKRCSLCDVQLACQGGCSSRSFFQFGTLNKEDPFCDFYRLYINYIIKRILDDPSILRYFKR